MQRLRRLQHFVDGTFQVKSLFRNVVVFAFDDRFEAFHRVGNLDVTSRRAGKLFGHVERLREESLNLSCPRNGDFLIFAQLVDAENRDDVLQVFIGLQRLFY